MQIKLIANPTSGATGTGSVNIMTYADARVLGDTVKVQADDIGASNANIQGRGVFLQARNSLILTNTRTRVGNGVAPGASGDPMLYNILNAVGIGLPNNTGPNLYFEAGSSMFTGDPRQKRT